MLPSKKLEELRSVIHRHLQANDVYSQLRSFVTEYVKENEPTGLGTEDDLLRAIQEKGVVEDLLRNVKSDTTGTGETASVLFGSAALPLKLPSFDESEEGRRTATGREALPTIPKSGGVYLHVRVLPGSAFGIETEDDPHAQCTLHVLFRGQRCSSRSVAFEAEPQFDESFLLRLRDSKDSGTPLLQMQDRIEVAVVRHERNGETSLIGTQRIDWRKVLASGFLSLAVELLGSASAGGAALSAGVLNLRIQLVPSAKKFIVPEVEIGRIVGISAVRFPKTGVEVVTDGTREVKGSELRQYLNLRASHAERMVKVFSAAEDGSLRPVFAFIADVRPGRFLESPRHALRFVTVLPLDRDETIGEGRSDVWNSVPTILAKGKASVEEKGLLLCSLLTAFGLDAYVLLGSKTGYTGRSESAVWCVTLTPGAEWATGEGVVLWDPVGGGRYENPTANARHIPLENVDFFANVQSSDMLPHVLFDIDNPRHWKSMGPATVEPIASALAPTPGPIPLLQPRVVPHQVEAVIEEALRQHITEYRRQIGLYTLWDEGLGFTLTAALSAYETERIVGVTVGNADFQHSIKRAVPEGNTFKGFPVQFVHTDPGRMIGALKAAPVALDILNTRGDGVCFGLRVKAFAYAESAVSVWVMVAVKYRPVLED